MSYQSKQICRKCSLTFTFLLFLQVSFAQYNFSKTDEWLKNNLNNLGGRAVLVIFKDGKIIHEKVENKLSPIQKMGIKFVAKRQGINKNEALEDYSFTTRTMIASSSKWLSAALVMTFVDEGKLNLYDSIGKFFPVFSKYQKGDVRIWQCLSHLTGINGGSLKESQELINKSADMGEVITKIAKLPMEGEPGKVFHYSSIGLQIAAAVIEKISGKDFETLFRERIAIPCEMKNTDFGKKKVALAAGGAYSTPEDYTRFLQMILQDGFYKGTLVLSKESVIKMQMNYTKDASVAYSPDEAGKWNYGFGEWVMDNTGERSESVTSPGLFGSFPWINNQLKYAGFLFVFNLKIKGRNENYMELKNIVDHEIKNL